MAGVCGGCLFWMLIVYVGFVCPIQNSKKSPVRETEYGQVQGVTTEPIPGRTVANYLGIPYAKPPVNKLRFEKTQKPDSWNGVRFVGELPPACPQNPNMNYVNQHSPGFNKEDEDCLYINVYVPERVSENTPVFLYVHGGSNRVGMGAMLRGDILAAFGDIIVVNFNYRLGSLGFYAARDVALTGNYGFFDQLMALHWVKDNIKRFGGDPEMITIAGHSAGAADVGFHVISPLSKVKHPLEKGEKVKIMYSDQSHHSCKEYKLRVGQTRNPGYTRSGIRCLGRESIPCRQEMKEEESPTKAYCLFHRAMIMSGSPIAFWGLAAPHWRAGYNIDEFCLRDLCPRHRDPKTFREYLMNLPWQEFTNYETTPSPIDYRAILTFPVSIIDGEFITERPETAIQAKRFNCDSFVFSVTRDEGSIDVKYVRESKMRDTGKFDEETFRDVLDWYKPIYPKVGELKNLIMHEYGGWQHFPNHTEEINILRRYTEMESDIVFVAPMVKLADLLTSAGVDDITFFTFDYRSEGNLSEWEGVPHGADLFYIFGIPYVGHRYFNYDKTDKQASAMVMTMWTNYVKTGVFSTGSTDFLKYAQSRSYNKLHLQNETLVVSKLDNYKPRRMAFWNSLLPSLSQSVPCSAGAQCASVLLYIGSIVCLIFYTTNVLL